MTKEALKLALEALEKMANSHDWFEEGDKAITAIKEALAQPEQEPVAQPASEEDMKIYKTIAANYHKDLSTPPQRERVLFPTMLRKMWSGSEVQAWLDENVNKEKNT